MFLTNPYFLGASSWTPASITTALWLDASDSATITITSGAVSQWNDKSGNSRNFSQASSTARPTVSTGALNGKDVILFDGSNDFMSTSYKFANTSSSDLSIFAVFKRSSGTTCSLLSIRGSGVPDGGNGWSMRDVSTPNLQYVMVGHSNVQRASVAAGTYYVAEVLRDGLDITLGVNGSFGSLTTAAGYNPIVGASGTFLGAEDGGTGSFLNGAVAELVVVESVVDSTTIDNFEAYFSAKWGV